VEKEAHEEIEAQKEKDEGKVKVDNMLPPTPRPLNADWDESQLLQQCLSFGTTGEAPVK